MATTYATWDSANKSADITLSGGDLIATNGVNAQRATRSTLFSTTGKWYFELTNTAIGASNAFVGVGTSATGLSTYIGADAYGYAYKNNGTKVNNASAVAYAATYTVGDVISVLLDLDAGELSFWKNGVDQGVAYTGISGSFCPQASTYGAAASFTANFGATAFAHTPPSGYQGV